MVQTYQESESPLLGVRQDELFPGQSGACPTVDYPTGRELLKAIADEHGVREKHIVFLAARMMMEIGLGRPLTNAEQRRVFNRCRLTLFNGLFSGMPENRNKRHQINKETKK